MSTSRASAAEVISSGPTRKIKKHSGLQVNFRSLITKMGTCECLAWKEIIQQNFISKRDECIKNLLLAGKDKFLFKLCKLNPCKFSVAELQILTQSISPV